MILLLAGVGVFLAGSLIFPGLPRILAGRKFRYEDIDNFLSEHEWEEFDQSRLKQRLKELHKQKVVRIRQLDEDKFVVQITKKGKRKLLQYRLNEMTIPKPNKWDGKWRIVAYDIPTEKKVARDTLRLTLKRLGLFELQKSVYLYPYPCTEAIEFIRELYEVGEHVTLLTVGYLEDEIAYKEYFSLS